MKYFQLSEFDSPDLPGSGEEMKVTFLNRLEEARRIAGVPFVINSGYRTPLRNKQAGGTPDSSHLKGYAADIKAVGSRSRFIIIDACLKAGFTRIGIGRDFIHVDNDPDKPGRVAWLY